MTRVLRFATVCTQPSFCFWRFVAPPFPPPTAPAWALTPLLRGAWLGGFAGMERVDPRAKALVQAAAAVVCSTAEDPREDARAERLKSTFDSDELAAFLADGPDKLRRK